MGNCQTSALHNKEEHEISSTSSEKARKQNEEQLNKTINATSNQQINHKYLEEIKDTMSPEAYRQILEEIKELGLGEINTKEDYNQAVILIIKKRFKLDDQGRPKAGGRIIIMMTPIVSTVPNVIDEMATKSHIVVLTGAGLSVASNIPTFRGDGGYWTLRNQQKKLKASDFLTHEYFVTSPEEIWRWHHEFRKLASKNSPNVSHHAIADFQAFCKKSNRDFTLVTQNIDGYHTEAYIKAAVKHKLVTLEPDGPKVPKELMKTFGMCDDIYEIHGSAEYMRCDKECTIELFASPEVGCDVDFVDKCPKCKGVARPHTLFFDECYEDRYYRMNSALGKINSMDCLVVIGTALETSLAAGIVQRAIQENQLIVEINPQPCIRYGNVRQLIGGAEKFVPDLLEGLQKKLLQ